jgi:hypothetical protein
MAGMGCAVVLQGRYIEHQGLRALGTTERISMVASFRPRCPDLPDDCILANVRPISNLSELYYEFSEYRLETLEERIRKQLKELRETKRVGKRLAINKVKEGLPEGATAISCRDGPRNDHRCEVHTST